MFRWLSLVAFAASLSAAPVAAAETTLRHVDDLALRYYASLGQKDRVAAEARRLSRLDSGWRMPDDLYSARPGRIDEAPLWSLYRDDRFDELARAIAARQSAEPGWTPSDDLLAKVKAKQLRAKIMTLAKAGQWHAVVESFKETGIAWAKDDAEALWVIAEAYARENDCAEAFVVYRSVLANHADPNERRATIEYAIPLIPMAMTEKLIAMGHADPAGKSEFDSIAIDITRARISAYLHDEPANDLSDAELKRFEDFVRDAVDPNEPGLVAWYDFKRRDYAQALDWFKLAISHGGDAVVAHGLAHTLDRLGRKREAEEVAYAWREPLVNNAILFIDLLETDLTKAQPPLIEPDRVARYAQVTMAGESGEGAQALAWYAYNTCQYPLALQWFERAVAWLPKEATVYGYALALQRLHRPKDFRDIVNRYDGLFPKVVALAFDDGIRKPPPPCEADHTTLSAPPRDPMQTGAGDADWAGRTMADTLRPQTASLSRDSDRSARFARARVPSPEAAAGASEAPMPPLRKRTDFPVSVSPENPLRFSVLTSVATKDLREHVPGSWPLVARRVPGVGAMPYERYGFVLRPGWDGTTDASSPAAMERPTPAGTLWALEQSLRDVVYHRAPAESVDALSRPPMAKAGAETPLQSAGPF